MINLPLIGAAVFLINFSILLHQKLKWGRWFDLDQILHHDTAVLTLCSFTLGLIIGLKIGGVI